MALPDGGSNPVNYAWTRAVLSNVFIVSARHDRGQGSDLSHTKALEGGRGTMEVNRPSARQDVTTWCQAMDWRRCRRSTFIMLHLFTGGGVTAKVTRWPQMVKYGLNIVLFSISEHPSEVNPAVLHNVESNRHCCSSGLRFVIKHEGKPNTSDETFSVFGT